jgi:hypothetical protein
VDVRSARQAGPHASRPSPLAWTIPGLRHAGPHDIALTAAPASRSGSADRLPALLVAPTCPPPGCGPLRRYLLVPPGFPLQVRLWRRGCSYMLLFIWCHLGSLCR